MNALDGISPRQRGTILVACGLLLGYFGYYDPLSTAQSHPHTLLVPTTSPVLSVVSLGLGLTYLVMGERYESFFGNHRKLSRLGWILLGSLAVLGFAGYSLLKNQLSALGYGS